MRTLHEYAHTSPAGIDYEILAMLGSRTSSLQVSSTGPDGREVVGRVGYDHYAKKWSAIAYRFGDDPAIDAGRTHPTSDAALAALCAAHEATR